MHVVLGLSESTTRGSDAKYNTHTHTHRDREYERLGAGEDRALHECI